MTEQGELKPIEVIDEFPKGTRVQWSDQYRTRTGEVIETDQRTRNFGFRWVKGDDGKLRQLRPSRLTKLPPSDDPVTLPLEIRMMPDGRLHIRCVELHDGERCSWAWHFEPEDFQQSGAVLQNAIEHYRKKRSS